MKIRSVKLKKFGAYLNEVTVFLPDSGVVLFSGPNGSGKSSVINAVSWCLWGKTLSGSRYDSEGTSVMISGPWGYVIRNRKASNSEVLSSINGIESTAITASAATKEIEAVFGSWEIWRRANVLSSLDKHNFSSSSDAERKVILEELLQLSRFDEALKVCKDDLKKLEDDKNKLKNEIVKWESKLNTNLGFLDKLSVPPTETPPIPGLKPDIDIRKLKELWVESFSTVSKTAMELERAKAAYFGFKSGICYECKKPLLEGTEEEFQGRLDKAVSDLADAEVQKLLTKTNLDEAQKAVKAWEVKSLQWTNWANEQNWRLTHGEIANKGVAEAGLELTRLRGELESLNSQEQTLLEVEKTLGPRGARVNMMLGAVDAINKAADLYLSKFGLSGITLVFGENNKLLLNVPWKGGSYGSLSGGERRRVDLAFQLALSTFSGQNSTLWLDEAFDALDKTGVGVAAEIADLLSAERNVIIVSHNPDLQDALSLNTVFNFPLVTE